MNNSQNQKTKRGFDRGYIGLGLLLVAIIGLIFAGQVSKRNEMRPELDRQAIASSCQAAIANKLGQVKIYPDSRPNDFGDKWTWAGIAMSENTQNRFLCVMTSPKASPELLIGDKDGKLN